MPSIPLHPPSPSSPTTTTTSIPSPLPPLLRTRYAHSSLAILEIQGTLHMPIPIPTPTSQSTSSGTIETAIGRLEFPLLPPDADSDGGAGEGAWMKKAYLYVGRNQRLTGEVRRLGTPVGVVGRRAEAAGAGAGEEGHADELQILDVVEYKIVFASRPEPVGE